jgi:hypothetical protein
MLGVRVNFTFFIRCELVNETWFFEKLAIALVPDQVEKAREARVREGIAIKTMSPNPGDSSTILTSNEARIHAAKSTRNVV